MNKIKKLLLALSITSAVCFGTSLYAKAAPVQEKIATLKQPDNTEVKVKVTGDEYYQEIESMDGYTLCRNSEGYICYAALNGNKSDFIATNEIYKDENYKKKDTIRNSFVATENSINTPKHLTLDKKYKDKKAEEKKAKIPTEQIALSEKVSAASSSTGNINGLTILINFPDQTSSISKNEINNFFNQTGYTGYSNNGSVKDFFNDVSGGKVTYTNTITEFYTAKHEKSYYDNTNIDDYSTAIELVDEAVNWLKSTGFDFSKLTLDSSGYAKGVNILYAGNADAGWSKGLWPHQGYLTTGFSSNGVKIGRYELSNIGTDLSLDTICHENGHLLFGYPDLYDYNNKSNGCGTYSLMSFLSDAKNPAPPDPYCRNVISGWNTNINLNSYSNGTTLTATSDNNGNHPVFKWTGNNPNEYYLIENLQKTGRYSYIPDSGIAVWHIDEDGDNSNYSNTPSSHYKVSIEQADNRLDLEKARNYGDSGDLYKGGYKTVFNDSSAPSSKWWNQTSSGLDISNISNNGSTMTFVKSGNTTPTTDPTTEKTNIALNSTATTSYCSDWENISALNDGFIPTNSNDRAHAVYGNWPKTDSQWVQYVFDKEYTISSTDVYWFKDGGGIDVPSSYRILYWDGSQWLDVPNAKGLKTLTNKFNTTTFNPINTNAIAIQMESNNSASTGILEWRVYA
ncbi:M6 family metalloprotease domain-containing protein [Clostridium sp. SHJSY1]|uniref:M6 family metalloprotease domain-containing protein n=1 Tax=Clostridium sp. SHJSY1 TaxID=2942483 RepID=UPI0028755A49|nr:M6 family metalloprotease domain-containing protein [Clostridium sp. SHJSY1]MDS0524489.1 M6 family metalloprotease domain-containing protein [Clostridium sp. SHJSY1]